MSAFITRLTTGCASTFQTLVEVEKMPDIPQWSAFVFFHCIEMKTLDWKFLDEALQLVYPHFVWKLTTKNISINTSWTLNNFISFFKTSLLFLSNCKVLKNVPILMSDVWLEQHCLRLWSKADTEYRKVVLFFLIWSNIICNNQKSDIKKCDLIKESENYLNWKGQRICKEIPPLYAQRYKSKTTESWHSPFV